MYWDFYPWAQGIFERLHITDPNFMQIFWDVGLLYPTIIFYCEPDTFYLLEVSLPTQFMRTMLEGRHPVYPQGFFEFDYITEAPLSEYAKEEDEQLWRYNTMATVEIWTERDAICDMRRLIRNDDWQEKARRGNVLLYDPQPINLPTHDLLEQATLDVDESLYEIWR